jgi:hypothetical protein
MFGTSAINNPVKFLSLSLLPGLFSSGRTRGQVLRIFTLPVTHYSHHKRVQRISLGCEHGEFYLLFLKDKHILNTRSWALFIIAKQIKL